MYKQLYDYMKEPLNQSRCSFCKAHLTQHAPFKLLLLWQKEFAVGSPCYYSDEDFERL